MPKMDFLLVGFVKAGTTSLDSILRQDSRIVLPQGTKETHFFDWNDRENALEYFWDTYYPKHGRSRLVGGIEPCYARSAKEVYETYGGDVKLLFMMRNPLRADYSLFKMGLKWGSSRRLISLYRKYPADKVADMYHRYTCWRIRNEEKDDYIRDEFRYEKWIEEYLQYYDLSQMKFILFEDFVREPEQVVSEVMGFLGLKDRKFDCSARSNEGGQISRNYVCAKLNYLITTFRKPLEYKSAKLRNMTGAWQEKLFSYTLVESKEPMHDKTGRALCAYYAPTKNYMERLLDRDLSEVWF